MEIQYIKRKIVAVCMYGCMPVLCACMRVYMYGRMPVCMYVCVHAWLFMCGRMPVYMHRCVYVCLCACMAACLCACAKQTPAQLMCDVIALSCRVSPWLGHYSLKQCRYA